MTRAAVGRPNGAVLCEFISFPGSQQCSRTAPTSFNVCFRVCMTVTSEVKWVSVAGDNGR